MKLTLDRLASVNAHRVGPAAYTLIDRLQGHRPEERAVGYAIAFLMLCAKLDCHPGNALQVAERVIQDSDVPELRAMKMYMEKEL